MPPQPTGAPSRYATTEPLPDSASRLARSTSAAISSSGGIESPNTSALTWRLSRAVSRSVVQRSSRPSTDPRSGGPGVRSRASTSRVSSSTPPRSWKTSPRAGSLCSLTQQLTSGLPSSRARRSTSSTTSPASRWVSKRMSSSEIPNHSGIWTSRYSGVSMVIALSGTQTQALLAAATTSGARLMTRWRPAVRTRHRSPGRGCHARWSGCRATPGAVRTRVRRQGRRPSTSTRASG